MTNIPVMISGFGYSVPKTVITNEDLIKLVDTSDEWITTRTGIKERHLVSGEENGVTLGTEAAKKALKKAKVNPEELDLIISATSIPTNAYPSTACEIQYTLGAKNAAAFDIAAACTGMIYALSVAKAFISNGTYKNILVVAAEANSRFVDWDDRATCVLFGDGAGAAVLQPSVDGKDDIIGVDLYAEGEKGGELVLPISGKNCPLVEPNEEKPLHLYMNGKEVYKFVMTRVPDSIIKCLDKANLKPEDIDYLIPHQANLRIIDALADRLGYSSEKVIVNIDKYGNTSAASIPIALVEGVEEGKIKLPGKAIFTAFGAGMTYGAAIVNLREGVA